MYRINMAVYDLNFIYCVIFEFDPVVLFVTMGIVIKKFIFLPIPFYEFYLKPICVCVLKKA